MLKQKSQKTIWFNRVVKRLNAEYNQITKPEIVEIEGIKIRLGSHVSKTIRKALYFGNYEAAELQMVKKWLKPEDVVMEVGAGLGLISSYCAKKIGDDRVFAYEANPALEQHIYDTYKLNGVNPTLELSLVGEQIGEKTFYIEKSFWSSSITRWNSDAIPIKLSMKSFNEEVRRIDPSFLIMDVEGGEYEILKEADFYNIQKISIELHEKIIGSEKAEFVKAKLIQAGFRLNEELYIAKEKGLEELFFHR